MRGHMAIIRVRLFIVLAGGQALQERAPRPETERVFAANWTEPKILKPRRSLPGYGVALINRSSGLRLVYTHLRVARSVEQSAEARY